MIDLNEARSAINCGLNDEASAVSLLSIAESLQTLVKLAVATHGVCVDCHHPWTSHYDRPDLGGCHATLGNGKSCVCTEPRQAVA